MSMDFENMEKENNEFSDEEDLEFFRKMFEAQSSDIVLPESLKAENLSKKYEKEIELIKKEAENVSEISAGAECKPNSVISIFRRKGFAAVAACVAFAGFLFFTSDFAKDNILVTQKREAASGNTAQKPMYSLNEGSAEAVEEAIPETAVYKEEEKSADKAAIVNDADIATGGSDFVGEIEDRALDIAPSPSANDDSDRNMLAAMPPPSNEELSKSGYDNGSNVPSTASISDEALSSNPLTGIDVKINAAKFLVSNGAEDYVGDEMLDFAEKGYKSDGHELYAGFLQRLY